MDASLNGNMTVPDTPRYDIATTGENHYRITMAVPGFEMDELKVEVADQTLKISGEKAKSESQPTYLYKGLSSQTFTHSFRLADHVKVVDARLDNGLLTVDLERIVPEELRPRTIKIEQGAPESLMSKAKKLLEGKSSNSKKAA